MQFLTRLPSLKSQLISKWQNQLRRMCSKVKLDPINNETKIRVVPELSDAQELSDLITAKVSTPTVRTWGTRALKFLFYSGLVGSPGLALLWLRPEGGSIAYDPTLRSLYTDMLDSEILYHDLTTSALLRRLFVYRLAASRWFYWMGQNLLQSYQEPGIFGNFFKRIYEKFLYKEFYVPSMEEGQAYAAEMKGKGIQVTFQKAFGSQSNWDMNALEVIGLVHEAETRGAKFVWVELSNLCSRSLLEELSHRQSKKDQPLSESALEDYIQLKKRLYEICQAAQLTKNLSLIIKAEESSIMPIIWKLCMDLSQKYNKERAVVYSTYQFYNKYSPSVLKKHLDKSREEKFFLGVHMVRGAYHEHEAAQQEPAVLLSKIPVDLLYEKSSVAMVSRTALHQPLELLISTHCLQSTLVTCQESREGKIASWDHALHFAQAHGMADNLSMGLAYSGFNDHKLTVIGAPDLVLPDFLRKMNEISKVSSGVHLERQLLWSEFLRRSLVYIFTSLGLKVSRLQKEDFIEQDKKVI